MPGQYGPAPFIIIAIALGILSVIYSILSIIKYGWRSTMDGIKVLFTTFFDAFKDLFRRGKS